MIDFTVNYGKEEIAYFRYLDKTDEPYRTQVDIISFGSSPISSFKIKEVLKYITYGTPQPLNKKINQYNVSNYGELVLISAENKIIF